MSHVVEVMGKNAPTHPALKAGLAMIEAAVKAMLTFEDTNPTFDTRLPAATLPEPGLLLKATAGVILGATLGQHDTFDALLYGIRFVVGRGQAAVGTGEPRRATKQAAVVVQTGLPLGFVGRVAVQ